uniref:nephrocystin-3 isoform X2 n=1 Tax=Myxine glutinosa TaxID=7769 RepID=UPI00358F5021
MGTGSSVRQATGELTSNQVVTYGRCTEVPIEMQPRRALKKPLKSVGSSRHFKGLGASLRSVASEELTAVLELERLRRECEILRVSKESEVSTLRRKEGKLDQENRRLRAELQALQKTCQKLRAEREAALEAKAQAMERAGAFSQDRDKLQRQFKIFRETKEREVRDLLHACQRLERKFQRLQMQGDSPWEIGQSDEESIDHNGSGSLVMSSEQSSGSALQTCSLMPDPGKTHNRSKPFAVSHEDWMVKLPHLLQSTSPLIPGPSYSTIRFCILFSQETHHLVQQFLKDYATRLRQICEAKGRLFLPMDIRCEDCKEPLESQRQEMLAASFYLVFLKRLVSRPMQIFCEDMFLRSPQDGKPLLIYLDVSPPELTSSTSIPHTQHGVVENEAQALISQIRAVHIDGKVKVLECVEDSKQNLHQLATFAEQFVKQELMTKIGQSDRWMTAQTEGDLDNPPRDTTTQALETTVEGSLDVPRDRDGGGCRHEGEWMEDNENEEEVEENDCEGLVRLNWDPHAEEEQEELVRFASRCPSPLGLDKYIRRLEELLASPGPTPPLLLSGGPGSGKSLLLAKWMGMQQNRSPSCLFLSHFVGQPLSTTAEPSVMIRRFIMKLAQHASYPVDCPNPARLFEDFPSWLEQLAARHRGSIVLIIDSIDRMLHPEQHLNWLMDPLPVNLRVVVSVNAESCPRPWRLWPTLHLDSFSPANVLELLRAQCAAAGCVLSDGQVDRLKLHFRSATTCNGLYITRFANLLARTCTSLGAVDEALLRCTQCHDMPSLFDLTFKAMDGPDASRKLRQKVLGLVLCSRDGLAEAELMELCPEVAWGQIYPIIRFFHNRDILAHCRDFIRFPHIQARDAVRRELLLNGRSTSSLPYHNQLVSYFSTLQQGRLAELLGYWKAIGLDRTSLVDRYQEALQIEEQTLSGAGQGGLWELARLQETLGCFLQDLGLFSQAVDLLQRCLELRETRLDPDHPSVARSLALLAKLYRVRRHPELAEKLLHQAAELAGNTLRSHDTHSVMLLESLVTLLQQQGLMQKAEHLWKKVLQQKPVRHTNTCASNILRRRIDQLESKDQEQDPTETGDRLNELGVLHYLLNQTGAAETYFQRSLAARDPSMWRQHPSCAQVLHNLAILNQSTGNTEQAEAYYIRALEIARRAPITQHSILAHVVKHLSQFYVNEGKLEEAFPLFQLAVDVRCKTLGPTHPGVATAFVNIAVLCCQMKRYDEALPLYKRALDIYECSMDPRHPRVAETFHNMAVLRYEKGDYEEAAVLYKRAQEIREQAPQTVKRPSRPELPTNTSPCSSQLHMLM